MRHFAEPAGEDLIRGVIGLLHDLDYEQYPQEHCHKTAEILTEKGVNAQYIRAIGSHGYGICTILSPRVRWRRHCIPSTS